MSDLHDALQAVLAERGLDGRTCFTSVYPEAPGGERLVLEAGNRDVAREVERRVDSAGLRVRVLPDDPALPGIMLANHSVVDVRRKPDHASELVSQAIHGDVLEPLKQEGDWYLVRMADRYIGWVRSWHLSAVTRSDVEAFLARARHRVSGTVIQVFEAPDERALPVTDAVVGTPVVAGPGGRRGWRHIELADGRKGFAPSKGIAAMPRGRRLSGEGLVATGMRFLGIPYLWGGTTPKGFDCSGLVQRIYRLHGLELPRDADMQARHGALKDTDDFWDLETGDLLFFGKSGGRITHVAMYLSDALFLHASGHVRVASLSPAHKLYESRLVPEWRLTRDPRRA